MAEKTRSTTTVVRHVAKMEKRDKVTSDIPMYSVAQSFFDPANNISAVVGNFIQTNAANWVRRMGSTFKKVKSVPDGHAVQHGIFVISDTVEDPEVSAKRHFKEVGEPA